MVCNVNHFSWPSTKTPTLVEIESFSRPLPVQPHPDTPYVVVLLKMLSDTDKTSDEDNIRR
ncbi:hypothetical protein DTL21_22375 [Bremerella cremea]|uniref:Uncharacterized protein n=1 Tax=Blastopirellula marina TaxID=124 RepID=A0A2S8FFJ6_9BACT|nr:MULTISPECIES: hypothetical protein [Pirellulaceae]PQO30945.1 hypothetical protein C5Y83_22340 [Blastopirellula marina]RCS44092.1 hypothetical protein DTL21_22375 [Bremerella cremea]